MFVQVSFLIFIRRFDKTDKQWSSGWSRILHKNNDFKIIIKSKRLKTFLVFFYFFSNFSISSSKVLYTIGKSILFAIQWYK